MMETGNNKKAWDMEKLFVERAEALRSLAELGVLDAQFALGLMYEGGEGVEMDLDQAVKWYRKAAEQGLADAQFSLGGMHMAGDGVKQDSARAVEWYRKAAEQGYEEAAKRMRELGFGSLYRE